MSTKQMTGTQFKTLCFNLFPNPKFCSNFRPEVDQFSTDNGPDDVVETLHVTANEAFGKFKNK